MASLLLITFFACNNDNDFMLTNATESYSLSPQDKQDGFMQLNSIPDEVVNKMTANELRYWKKIASKFYINYDFINTDFYKHNKNLIIKYALRTYNDTQKRNLSPTKLYISCSPNSSKKLNSYKLSEYDFEDDSTATPTDCIHYHYTYTVTNGVSFEVYTILLPLTNSDGSIYAYEALNTEFVCYPPSAKFYGSKTIGFTNQGVANINANGFIYYNNKRYNISINEQDSI